jgi:dimethylargininase
MPWLALTRAVSPTLADCELTHLDRSPIDVARAAAQHAQYEAALVSLGCTVERVAPAPDHPDAVFIEDTAVVLDELAIITRPGAASRRPEVDAVADVLARHRPLHRIEAPGTLDGGDVLVLGRRIYVGRTRRSNDDGIRQLQQAVAPHGYLVEPVVVTGCLHLKSAVTALDSETVLCNAAWVDPAAFAPAAAVLVATDEPGAANVVRVGDHLLAGEAYQQTNAILRAHGYAVTTVPADELAKAEGAVTCCSVLLRLR